MQNISKQKHNGILMRVTYANSTSGSEIRVVQRLEIERRKS